MEKLIKKKESGTVVCDNPNCDVEIVINDIDNSKRVLKDFINVGCPKCSQNLLTQKDYDTYTSLIKYIDFINKWFSWITIFTPKSSKRHNVNVKVHEGITIKNK